ncbi:MAG: hypothetical protein AAF638_06370, partial [Pseudomonadota bacterium]
AALMGVTIGLGLLAKYAAIYFVLSLVFWLVVDRSARTAISPGKLAVAALFILAILAPNIAWNVENGLITFLHTKDNINWEGELIRPAEAAEFFGAQFGVFGPIPMALLLWIAFRPPDMSTEAERRLRMMVIFSLPIVAIIVFQALMSRAHANWAAPAYVAGTLGVTAYLVITGRRMLLYATLALHAIVPFIFIVGDTQARTLKFPGEIDPYYRTLGYGDLARASNRLFEAGDYMAILTDWRRTTGTHLYYLRDAPPPIVTWPANPRPTDHFQMSRPLTADLEGPFLLVTACNERTRLDAAFESWKLVDTIITKGGPRYNWIFFAVEVSGPKWGEMPPPDCHRWAYKEDLVPRADLPPRRE